MQRLCRLPDLPPPQASTRSPRPTPGWCCARRSSTRALELLLLADAVLASAADAALDAEPGRGSAAATGAPPSCSSGGPGLGVQELARLTGLSKQGASRTLCDLEGAGLAEKSAGRVTPAAAPSP